MTSNVPSIHAIGDVTHRVDLTPVAIREGHTLADRLFGKGERPIRYDAIASTVFGTPELGAVGLTESEALRALPERRHLQGRLPAAEGDGLGQRRARDHEAGRRRPTDRILGAHILGREAGEMIQLVAVAMTMGATKADFDATVAVIRPRPRNW